MTASSVLALAACSAEPAETIAPPAETPTATATVMTLSSTDLDRVCRAVLSVVHEQSVADMRVDGRDGEVVRLSWPAPVDGGRRFAECRVEGDQAIWRPTGLPEADANRWMNQAGDPAIQFGIDGESIAVTQTLTDGASTRTVVVSPEEEAR